MRLITTIIPTYKRPKLLERAINSALGQTFPHILVHIYDNASNDETEEIVRRCALKDHRVKYHRHPKNIGLLRNYQYGLSEVETEYFSFLSDDDVLFPWFYEETLKAFKQSSECAFSAGSAIIMSEKGNVIRVPLDLWERDGLFFPPKGLLEMITKYPAPSCILFHRKVLKTISIDIHNSLTWDCDYLMQIAARYPFYISKRPCGIFLHHESYSNSKGLEDWTFSLKKMMERINLSSHLSKEIKEKAVGLINSDLTALNRSFIFKSIFNRKFKEANSYAVTFKRNNGLSLKSLIFVNLTRFCLWFPFLVYPLLWIRSFKKFVFKMSCSQYAMYAKWIKQ